MPEKSVITHDNFIPSAISYCFNCKANCFLSFHETPFEINRPGKAFLKQELTLLEEKRKFLEGFIHSKIIVMAWILQQNNFLLYGKEFGEMGTEAEHKLQVSLAGQDHPS